MRDLPIFLAQINSVSDEIDQHVVLIAVILYFSQPRGHAVERVPFRHVVDHYCGLAVLVEELCDRAELLLTGCVPNLELYQGCAL